jgi:gas vesicle protein
MNRFLCVMILAGVAVGVAAGTFAADLKSPDRVKVALGKLAHEYSDMQRKLAADRYDRLPHENQEFQEESGALREAIADQPADFKATVQAALERTLSAATRVADVSATHDKKQVESALESLATLLTSLNALFPERLRVEPVLTAAASPTTAYPAESGR